MAAGGHDGAISAPVAGHPIRRIVSILVFVVVAGAFASLVGWDIRGWFQSLRDTLTTITIGYIVAAVVALTPGTRSFTTRTRGRCASARCWPPTPPLSG